MLYEFLSRKSAGLLSHLSATVTSIMLVILLCSVGVAAENTGGDQLPPADVMAAAQDGLLPFLETIPRPAREKYGIPVKADIKELTLGRAYRIHTITPDALDTYVDGAFSTLVTPTTLWFFQVMFHDEACCILKVDHFRGRYRATVIGSSGIAREMHQIETEYPTTAGFPKTFVRVYQATSDLVLMPDDNGGEIIVGLRSARISLELDTPDVKSHALWKSSRVVNRLQSVVLEGVSR